jgi:hypothetical protein
LIFASPWFVALEKLSVDTGWLKEENVKIVSGLEFSEPGMKI